MPGLERGKTPDRRVASALTREQEKSESCDR